jgi:hypothetical protein
MFEIGRNFEQFFDVADVDDLWQFGRLFRAWNLKEKIFTMQNLFKIKLHGIQSAVNRIFREFQLINAVKKITTKSCASKSLTSLPFRTFSNCASVPFLRPYFVRVSAIFANHFPFGIITIYP